MAGRCVSIAASIAGSSSSKRGVSGTPTKRRPCSCADISYITKPGSGARIVAPGRSQAMRQQRDQAARSAVRFAVRPGRAATADRGGERRVRPGGQDQLLLQPAPGRLGQPVELRAGQVGGVLRHGPRPQPGRDDPDQPRGPQAAQALPQFTAGQLGAALQLLDRGRGAVDPGVAGQRALGARDRHRMDQDQREHGPVGQRQRISTSAVSRAAMSSR